MKQYIKLLSVFSLFSLCSIVLAPHTFAFSGIGIGTTLSPYEIRTCTQLQEARQSLAAHYKLVNDIDCADVSASPGWVPIGFVSGSPFTGTLDGDGYTISNISYTGNGPAGLFGYVENATIHDVTVSSSVFNSIGHVGAIAGDVTNSTMQHVHAYSTTTKADNRLGGLVGIITGSSISDSSVTDGSIIGRELGTGSAYIGGAAGHSTNTAYSRISVTGTVTGNESVANAASQIGGFAGYTFGGTIQDSYTTADITGGTRVGGFIGSAASTSVSRSWASGSISAITDVGGFYGYEGLSSANNSFAMGEVAGNTNIGGFIGHAVAIGLAMPTSLWDVDRSGIADCVGLDESISFATTCVGINAGAAAPNYFFNTSSHTPLNTWDFVNTWRTTSTTPLLITSPDRPDNVRVTRAANSLIPTWEIPADTGGGIITSYDIKYRKSADQSYTLVSGISDTSYAISGLTPETEYIVEIRAQNARGKGSWLGFITYTTAAPPAVATPQTVTTTTSTNVKKLTPTTAAQYALDTIATEYPTGDQSTDQITSEGGSTSQANQTSTPKPETDTNNYVTKITAAGGVIILVAGLLGILQYIKKP